MRYIVWSFVVMRVVCVCVALYLFKMDWAEQWIRIAADISWSRGLFCPEFEEKVMCESQRCIMVTVATSVQSVL